MNFGKRFFGLSATPFVNSLHLAVLRLRKVRARLLPALLWVLAAPSWADLAIVGGRVYTLEDQEPLVGATVLVADGRIEAVGVDLPAPFAYRRVDATGKIVTPGLIESYSHIGLREIGLESTTDDATLLEHPLGPAFDVSYALNPASTLIPVNRMEGVTRALTFPLAGVDPLAGAGRRRAPRRRVSAGAENCAGWILGRRGHGLGRRQPGGGFAALGHGLRRSLPLQPQPLSAWAGGLQPP